MEKAFARMDEAAVTADLDAPDPMKTVKERPKSAPKPAAPAKPEPSKPAAADADELEGGEPASPSADKPADKPAGDQPKPGDEDLSDAELKASKPPQQAGPWKLKKYWEKRAAAVEQELAEARKLVAEAAKSGDALKRAADIEKRNTELEEEIRYHNFAKSQEFADKYQKPYEEAWAAASQELAELDVLNEDGTPARKAVPKDLLALANMPLGEARKAANQMFGDSADDVMAHRRKIQEMSKAQAKALDDARKTATDRTERSSATQQAVLKEVTETWTRANAEVAAKLDILKPKEGDDEWNGKLDAATKLIDEAFSVNAADPSLTPEQRTAAIKKHVAARNRAIAYSPLMLEVKRLRAQLAERDEKLKAYEGTAPNGGNGGKGPDAKQPESGDPMERAFRRLEKAAVPMSGRFL